MKRLDSCYKKYLSELSESDEPLSKKDFLQKLVSDSKFSRAYGNKITKALGLDERLEIAYPDREERMTTLIFMGTLNTKKLLNKLKIPSKKILVLDKDIQSFLNS